MLYMSYPSLYRSQKRSIWKQLPIFWDIWKEIQDKVYFWEVIQIYKYMSIVILIGGHVLLLDDL